jgi:hypothetical protein
MNPLNFPLQKQLCTEWCWAAVGAAICACLNDENPLDQRGVADLILGSGAGDCDCHCDSTDDSLILCNKQQSLSFVLARIGHLGEELASADFDQIVEEIKAGQPLAVQVELSEPAASGHVVAIYGYGDGDVVWVADPLMGGSGITTSLSGLAQGSSPLHATWKTAYKTIPQ